MLLRCLVLLLSLLSLGAGAVEVSGLGCPLLDIEATRKAAAALTDPVERQRVLGEVRDQPLKGMLVKRVPAASPAEKAGLRAGDVVMLIDSAPATSESMTQQMVAGKEYRLTISRPKPGRTGWVIDHLVLQGEAQPAAQPRAAAAAAAAPKAPAAPAADKEHGFRGAKWGMSFDEVKRLETEPIDTDISTDTLLAYDTKVGGLKCLAGYVFINNKLVRGKYILTEKHANDNRYLDDYLSLKKLLTEKYGKPAEDEVLWQDNVYKNRPDSYGTAIGAERLSLFAVWKTAGEEITLFIRGKNFDIRVAVEYKSLRLQHEADKKKAEEDRKGL